MPHLAHRAGVDSACNVAQLPRPQPYETVSGGFGCRRYYVEAQEKELLGTLDSLVAEETWQPADEAAGAGVLRSASKLFGEIKKSLLRCSKYITRGPALLQLMTTFQARASVQLLPLFIRNKMLKKLAAVVQRVHHERPCAAAADDHLHRRSQAFASETGINM